MRRQDQQTCVIWCFWKASWPYVKILFTLTNYRNRKTTKVFYAFQKQVRVEHSSPSAKHTTLNVFKNKFISWNFTFLFLVSRLVQTIQTRRHKVSSHILKSLHFYKRSESSLAITWICSIMQSCLRNCKGYMVFNIYKFPFLNQKYPNTLQFLYTNHSAAWRVLKVKTATFVYGDPFI